MFWLRIFYKWKTSFSYATSIWWRHVGLIDVEHRRRIQTCHCLCRVSWGEWWQWAEWWLTHTESNMWDNVRRLEKCCDIHMLFYDDGAMRLATCLVSLISWALAAAWQRPDRLQLPKPIITTCCELLHQPLSPRPRRCWPLTSNNLLSTVSPQIGKVLLEGWAAK